MSRIIEGYKPEICFECGRTKTMTHKGLECPYCKHYA